MSRLSGGFGPAEHRQKTAVVLGGVQEEVSAGRAVGELRGLDRPWWEPPRAFPAGPRKSLLSGRRRVRCAPDTTIPQGNPLTSTFVVTGDLGGVRGGPCGAGAG